MSAVSVLLPCYNTAVTLPDAMDSLANQTLADFDVVAVDDGSNDATLQVLEEWSARDRRVSVIRQPHGGIVKALNNGLAACTAPYVARMDADDRSPSDRLERQVTFLNNHPEIALVSCLTAGFPAAQVGEGLRLYLDWQNSLLTDEAIRREIFIESPFPHPSVTFRREAIRRIGFYQDHGWAEDYDLWLRLYLAGARFARLPDYLLEWRESPSRLTRTDDRYAVENFLRAKAHYLVRGPLKDRDALIIWGAGVTGKRISRLLLQLGAPLKAFLDVDRRKIGVRRRNVPVLSPDELPSLWASFSAPVLLVAVGARGARSLIRPWLVKSGFQEGQDWWFVA